MRPTKSGPFSFMETTRTPSRRITSYLKEFRSDTYWALQALRPNLKINLQVRTDWQPKYRLRRFFRKGACEICGKRFREIEEGTISKRETLCGTHALMTTEEIGEHHSRKKRAQDNSGPIFEHKCNSCVFLGRHEGNDLYYCETTFPTVIARHSSEGGDYTSGLLLDGVDPLITEGANRARTLGYLTSYSQET